MNLNTLFENTQSVAEQWSQKYKSSINCSHPKGFSQKAHCAGKKKHNESVEMEMVCEDCGMCQTHGSLNEIKKGQKDSNGYTNCWSGYHAAGTKKSATTGKSVRNCVPNESIQESKERCMQCGMQNCKCPGDSCKCKPIAGWEPGKGFKKAMDEAANAAQQAAIAIAKKKKQDMAESSQRVDSLVTDALKIMHGSEMSDAVAALKTVLGDREYNDRRGHYSFYVRQLMDMYGQQGNLKEFAPGNGGGESGRWYTDDQMTDLVGDGWWNDLDVSGDVSKQEMIQQAQAWLDDQGYSVQVLNCKVNDDDMEWYVEGAFHNPRFAKKGVAEAELDEARNDYYTNRTGFKRGARDPEGQAPAPDTRTWYIRLNGKLIRDKAGNPYSFRDKATANNAALTMQAKLFNKGKEFVLTTNPNDKPQGVSEADMNRRGFLRGLGAAALAGAAGGAMAQSSQQQDLGNGFVLTTIDVAGHTVKAVLDTESNISVTPNRGSNGSAIIRSQARFLLVKDGKIVDTGMDVGPATKAAMKKAGLLPGLDESQQSGYGRGYASYKSSK